MDYHAYGFRDCHFEKVKNLKKCERRPAVTRKRAWKIHKIHIKTHIETFTMFKISENVKNPKFKHPKIIVQKSAWKTSCRNWICLVGK